jgi:hypothetical protein
VRNLAAILLLCAVSSGAGAADAAETQLANDLCVGDYPDAIEARLAQRDRIIAMAHAASSSGVGLASVFDSLKTWTPGQTISVAFHGGSAALRADIAAAAAEWTRHANLKLDFGPDGTFRDWSPSDAAYAADIRISFDYGGNWSLVGSDSVDTSIVPPGEPSMNFGGYKLVRPSSWRRTVLHEFGHALGFHHEHQHPEGCDAEFRWSDDAGYSFAKDEYGQYIVDAAGRRPGIYTVLGGPPNNWPPQKVDWNLRRLKSSSSYQLRPFDRLSIMKYFFESWMFVSGNASFCYTPVPNPTLSEGDKAAARDAYPGNQAAIESLFRVREEVLRPLQGSPLLDSTVTAQRVERILESG